MHVLTFKSTLNSDFTNYPINELDEEFFKEHAKPPSGKYAKMLVRATPIANDLWEQSLDVKNTLSNVKHVLDFSFTDRGLESFVEICAALNIEMIDFNKILKRAKQESELEKYYNRFDEVYLTNIFDLMSSDLPELIELTRERNMDYNMKYVDNVKITHTVDSLKEYFKVACKAYKAKKEDIIKQRKNKG